MWHRTNKKLPKKMDYYLISDGKFYSVAIFYTGTHTFLDRNYTNPILPKDVKYWKKISIVPKD